MEKPSIRRLVLDRVVGALEALRRNLPVMVEMREDGKLVVTADLSALTRATSSYGLTIGRSEPTPPRPRERPPGRREDARPAILPSQALDSAEKASGISAQQIRDVLDPIVPGLNLADIAKKLNVTKKRTLTPLLKAMRRVRKLERQRGRWRIPGRVRRGRKPASGHTTPRRAKGRRRGARAGLRRTGPKPPGRLAPTPGRGE